MWEFPYQTFRSGRLFSSCKRLLYVKSTWRSWKREQGQPLLTRGLWIFLSYPASSPGCMDDVTLKRHYITSPAARFRLTQFDSLGLCQEVRSCAHQDCVFRYHILEVARWEEMTAPSCADATTRWKRADQVRRAYDCTGWEAHASLDWVANFSTCCRFLGVDGVFSHMGLFKQRYC